MTSGIKLGTVFGVPLVGDVSALVLVLLFAGAVFLNLERLGSGSTGARGAVAVGAGFVMLGCVFAHEFAHGFSAQRLGLHVRSVRLFMFGGYSVIDGQPTPAVEWRVAGAGPIASLVMALIFWAGSMALGSDSIAGSTMIALALANAVIGLFNLLPAFPLDGARMLRAVLVNGGRDPVVATRSVVRLGRWTAGVVMIIGVVLLLQRNMFGLFVLVGGWFLLVSSSDAGLREMLSVTFDGETVGDLMRRTSEAVSGNATVSNVLDGYADGPNLRLLPVELDGRVVGVISQVELDSVAPSRWPSTRIRSLMVEIGPNDVVSGSAPAETMLLPPVAGNGYAIVVSGDVAVGIIDRSDLAGRVE